MGATELELPAPDTTGDATVETVVGTAGAAGAERTTGAGVGAVVEHHQQLQMVETGRSDLDYLAWRQNRTYFELAAKDQGFTITS
jgi:hypothetical protein